MTPDSKILVEHVGKQRNRVDNVLHTARIWPERGSVLEIPYREAQHYLKYPTVWRELDPQTYAAREAARAAAAASMEDMRSAWDGLTIEDLERIGVEIASEVKRRRSAPPPEAKQPDSDESPVSVVSDDADSRKAAVDRQTAIMAVIKDLDRNDSDQWSQKTKMPKVPVVSDRVGFAVSVDEVRDALDLIEATRA